jgi:activating signal cointegrator 1
MKIQAISLWNPWATFMARGLKRIETRSWRFPSKLPAVLAIHATKKVDEVLLARLINDPKDGYHFRAALEQVGVPPREFADSGHYAVSGSLLPAGAVVAVVRLVACLPTGAFSEAGAKLVSDVTGVSTTYPRILRPEELAFGDYSPGRYAWVTDAVFRLDPPVPQRGAQGLFWWDATPEVEAWVYEHLKTET